MCGIIGYIKKHNRLLHSENQMDEGNHAVNVSAATINQSKEVKSFLQMVPVSKKSGCNWLNTYAFLDSGSTVSFIDQNVQEKLRAQCTDVTLNKAGIHGTKDLKTDCSQRCIQSKRLNTPQSPWETRIITKTS